MSIDLGKLRDGFEKLFDMYDEAIRMGASMGKDDDEVKSRAEGAAMGKQVLSELMDAVEEATSLSKVLGEVGAAVRKVGSKRRGADPDEMIEAGIEALEPRGDDDDDVRAGLYWLVLAAGSGSADEEEEEEEEDDRESRRARRRRGF